MKRDPKSHYFLIEVIDRPNSDDGETYLKPKEIREAIRGVDLGIGGEELALVRYFGTKKPKLVKA